MTVADRFRLIGSYPSPRLRVGDRATCLYRDIDVVITSWTDGRISWPRCRALDQKGGSGLLVDETLKRAIETESAEVLEHWFGVTHNVDWKWRRTFGIGRRGTRGSKRAYKATADALADQLRGKPLSVPTLRKMSTAAVERNAAKTLREFDQRNRRPWPAEHVALLGTMPDTQLARRLDRSRSEVQNERRRRGIPPYRKPAHPEALLSADERERLRRERIAAAKRGKPRPRHVVEAMRKGRTGKPHSPTTRAKMRAARLAYLERKRSEA